MRTFKIVRKEDQKEVSGTGVVAEGSFNDDGSTTYHWVVDAKCSDGIKRKIDSETTIKYGKDGYSSWELVILLHGHGGRTFITFDDTNIPISDVDVLEYRKVA